MAHYLSACRKKRKGAFWYDRPMLRETFAELAVAASGGPDRKAGGTGPVVVLLHGFGAPGEDLVPLFRVLDVPREVRFVFPAAPIELPLPLTDARAWWMIDLAEMEESL